MGRGNQSRNSVEAPPPGLVAPAPSPLRLFPLSLNSLLFLQLPWLTVNAELSEQDCPHCKNEKLGTLELLEARL